MANDKLSADQGLWQRFKCGIGLHGWYIDHEAGASGHSMDEAIAFLYCNLVRCHHCEATTWKRK